MSINHYSSLDLPETTLWWTQSQQQQQILMEPTIPNPSWPRFNLNNDDDDEDEEQNNNEQATTSQEQQEEGDEDEAEEAKEPMFEKPLTPSDVGKLNRLVIPKQHAEKYFPLGAASAAASTDSGECKGLLLSFEDESGKCWRFRYSYWNSSQSYVLTKGWSRYVKDKRLDAGDVVSFERHRGDSQRLFIRWRRRGAGAGAGAAKVSRVGPSSGGSGGGGGGGGVGVGWTSGFYCAHPSYPTHHHHNHNHNHQQLAYLQQHEGPHAGLIYLYL